jgi:hypothetical protein
LDTAALRHKMTVIDKALALHRPDPADPVDVLAKVGGLTSPPCAVCFWGRRPCASPWWWTVSSPRRQPCAPCALRPPCGSTHPIAAFGRTGARQGHADARPHSHAPTRHAPGEGSGCPLAFSLVEAACALPTTWQALRKPPSTIPFSQTKMQTGKCPRRTPYESTGDGGSKSGKSDFCPNFSHPGGRGGALWYAATCAPPTKKTKPVLLPTGPAAREWASSHGSFPM